MAALAAVYSFAGRRVLEVGCGDGRLTRRYADVADYVLAIDPDAAAIAALSADMPPGRVDARAAEFLDARLPSASFDVVLFAWSL
jgi:2-polyprenyl-3-methyl-5-hydroxy-6-metoxy-1,4-benzoquinol methylase